MKIAILGDLHFGARNANDAIMYHQKKFFDFFFKYLENNNIDTIFQLGDIFDNRRQTNSKALSFAYLEFFDKLQSNNIKMYSLIGNHDLYYKENIDIHTGGILLRQFNNIVIFDEPTTVKLGGCSFDFIPWICDANKEVCMHYMNDSPSEYCLGHFEINNFDVMPNVPFTDGLDSNIFRKYNKVFSGHFHQKSDRDNIYYAGTPYQLNWTDVLREKSFIVFDTETHAYEDVINNDNYHQYVYYDDVNKEYTNISELEPHTFIRLVIKNKQEPYLFNTFTKKLYETKPADVKFVENKRINLNEQDEIKLNIQTMEDIIADYIRNSDMDNKEELIKYMLMIHNEALMGGGEQSV